MSLGLLVQYGTPVILFVLIIMQALTSFMTIILWKKLDRMEEKIVWRDTCLTEHRGVEQRFERLERAMNGRLG